MAILQVTDESFQTDVLGADKPVVVVCIDGGDPEYFESGIQNGIIPNTEDFMKNGFYSVAQGSMPSFTCPNNMSIVTGSEPVTHGISGNFYLDRKSGEPVVMTGPDLLRSNSIMSEFSKKYSVRGIRGATTVEEDSKELIKEATKELLIEMVDKNEVLSDDIAAVFFTTTSDISDEFPAVAAREMGWDTVPLICGHEMDVPHGLDKCIRILILWNTEIKQKEIRHPYLKKAITLRKSGNDFEAS